MENLQFVLLFSDDGLHFNDEDDYEKVDICHFYTFTHQFMVEPELFYPEVGSHDLVPQILNSFTMSNIIKEHSLQAQSIII